jgi:hypothetical protein
MYEMGVKKEETFRGKTMKKMLKIMAMLLLLLLLSLQPAV